MKNNKEDKLEYIFRQTSLTKPKDGFDQKLMQKIYLYEKKRKKRSAILNSIAISGGVITLLLTPIIILYSFGRTLSDIANFGFIRSLKNISSLDFSIFDTPVAFLPISILLLLIADILIRKKLIEKDKTQNKSKI